MYKKNIFLIILFLVIIMSVVFRVGFNTDTFTVSRYFVAQLGSAIGVSASVPSNPFSTLAIQLEEKEKELEQRENLLEQKNKNQGRIAIYLSVAIGTVLLFLILLNFYFDYRKRNRI